MALDRNEAEKNAAKFPPAKTIAEQILTNAQDSRAIVQDFVPLATSLEWELGREYLRARGNKAFISDSSPVPFVVNNDGNLSRNVAEVFFASLLQADKAGTLEPDIHVLELGIGVGLFARFFLDHFQELCEKGSKDYYDRLTYVAADRSERMLQDVIRHGVLAPHLGRYRVRVVDAMTPEKDLPFDVAFHSHPRKDRPFRAVFLNYLLDCLPASVLQIEGDTVKELQVRTCVARNVKLEDFTDMSVEQLAARAKSNEPRAKQELLEVYGLFASEYDYRSVEIDKIPYGKFALDYGKNITKRLLVSHGAIYSLERLLGLIADDGFIFFNEYGQTQTSRDDEFEHQRFSMATFVGVNFPLLKAYFAQPGKGEWTAPTSEAGGIHSRLLCPKRGNDIMLSFWKHFSSTAYGRLHEPIQQDRACARSLRFELTAIAAARGDYFVLLNNDTVVTEGWLNALINLANLSPTFDMVGPMSTYAAPPQLVEVVAYRMKLKQGKTPRRFGVADRLLETDAMRAFSV